MKQLSIVLAFCLALCCGAVHSNAQTKKYDIKSGIITFKTTMKMGGFESTEKAIVYFDEYGMKECRDEYEGATLQKSLFSDGKDLYNVVHAKKSAFKSGRASRGTELRFAWDEVSSRDIKEGKAKKLPGMSVAGKDCEAFEHVSGSTTSTFAGWGHILLFMETKSGKTSTISKAVSIQENAKVPAAKFAVPAGYAVKDSPY